MLVAVLLAITGGFAGFDLFFTMTNGGPFGATEVPATWIMKQAFDKNQLSYGVALTVVLAVVVMVISLVYLRLLGAAQCPPLLSARAAPAEWVQFARRRCCSSR